ncbi:unnamed protein product [Periconia digitata]|uniref:N-acetyltransferase domain-containing protein n=1 Tax=Periconia digitata TaxID=1303443 RepID=A0A9W4XE51_9PLEO|nr:unnamed protein product [Periconia digitata]
MLPRNPIVPELWDSIVEKQKDLRLTALTLDPSSFSSTREREVRFEHKDWEARLLNPLVYTLVAIKQDASIATAISLVDKKGFHRLASQSWLGNAVLYHKEDKDLAQSSIENHNDRATFYIEGFYVLPRYRSLGIGASLIQNCKDYVFSWAHEHSCKYIKLCVRVYTTNEKAIRLYRKHGFKTSLGKQTSDVIMMDYESEIPEG